MRLALDTRQALIERLPQLRLEHLRAIGGRKRLHDEARQQFLIQLLTISHERRHKHADPNRRHADSFSSEFLATGLHLSKRDKAYQRFLVPFYDFEAGNRGYVKGRFTKSYCLKPEVQQTLDSVYSGNSSIPVLLQTEDGSIVVKPGDLPPNGIPEPISSCLSVPSVLPITVHQVDRAIARVQQWGETCGWATTLDPKKWIGTTLREAIRHLQVCRKWVVSLGGLPNGYDLMSNGRLGPCGSYHLICLPSRIRHLLFESETIADFDLVAAHFSILASVGRAMKFDVTAILDYLSHRQEYHEHWSMLTNQPVFPKAVATSWLTGGTLSPAIRTSGAKQLGAKAVRSLREDATTMRLYRQVQKGMKCLVAKAVKDARKSGVVTNAAGARYTLSRGRGNYAGLCSHLLTGLEQWAIKCLCENVTGLKAIIYDGWISQPADTASLETLVKDRSAAELGVSLDLRLKVTPYSIPLPDLEPPSDDF